MSACFRPRMRLLFSDNTPDKQWRMDEQGQRREHRQCGWVCVDTAPLLPGDPLHNKAVRLFPHHEGVGPPVQREQVRPCSTHFFRARTKSSSNGSYTGTPLTLITIGGLSCGPCRWIHFCLASVSQPGPSFLAPAHTPCVVSTPRGRNLCKKRCSCSNERMLAGQNLW